LRFAPSLATLIAAAVFIVPAFLKYEPRTTKEPVSLALAVLAVIASTIIFGALHRAISAVLQSNRVMKRWMVNAVEQPMGLDGISVHRCRHDSPVIAVLGLWRTRIFVSDEVFEVLSAEELNAALRHEAVHARGRDTFKKLLLHLSPNVFPTLDLLAPVRESWARTRELCADEEAVCHDAQRTLSLASALVKVARLSCSSEMPTLSAALKNDGQNFLSYRVERLLQISEVGPRPSVESDRNSLGGWAVCAGVLLLGVAAYPQALSFTHELLELFVRTW
jgi:Zn-dependent protease with chaperone function